MKKSIYARCRLVCSAVLLAVAVTAALGAATSYSWLSENRRGDAGIHHENIEPPDGGLIATLHSYPVTAIAAGVYTYDTSTESAMLPQYDTEGISYSQYEKALVIKLTVENIGSVEKDVLVSLIHDASVEQVEEEYHLSEVTQISNAHSPAAAGNMWQVTKSSEPGATKVLKDLSSVLLSSATVGSGETAAFYFLLEYNATNADTLIGIDQGTLVIGETESGERIAVLTNDVYFSISGMNATP